ncbi:hypothetical protein GCM10020219_096740 [Nonomuraea dietziae]
MELKPWWPDPATRFVEPTVTIARRGVERRADRVAVRARERVDTHPPAVRCRLPPFLSLSP